MISEDVLTCLARIYKINCTEVSGLLKSTNDINIFLLFIYSYCNKKLKYFSIQKHDIVNVSCKL